MRLEAERILRAVQAEFGVTRAQLMASTRSSRDVAWARQVAVHLCHLVMPELSWSELGRLFGRDRTTVRHAHLKVADWRDLEDLDHRLEELQRVCTAAPV